MLKTELELAVRVTVDLSRPITAPERVMLGRVLALAKDVSAVRGLHDPAIALIEQKLAALPEALPASDPPLKTSLAQAEADCIRRVLGQSRTLTEAAERLGTSIRTLRRRMLDHGIPFEQVIEHVGA